MISTLYKTGVFSLLTVFTFGVLAVSPVLANDDDGGDCRSLTISAMQKGLEDEDFTSEDCVRSMLVRINEVSPVNPPFVVHYTGDNLAAFNELEMRFPGLNSFISINNIAIDQAKQADQMRESGVKKLLLGIPISVKANHPTLGLGFSNSFGNFAQIGYTPAQTNVHVQALIDAGAIIIGQNNMDEYGMSSIGINFAFGPARNAYDLARISGGSSSGAANAVAARLVPAALGNDARGSVRTPAALNGVIGYRPTTSRYSLNEIASNFDVNTTNGTIARSIKDIVLLDQVLAPVRGVTPVDVDLKTVMQGLRLGVSAAGYQDLEPELQAVVNAALARLEKKGAILVHFPDVPGLHPWVLTPVPGGDPYDFFKWTLFSWDVVQKKSVVGFIPYLDEIAVETGIPTVLNTPGQASYYPGWKYYLYDGTFTGPSDPDLAAYKALLAGHAANSLASYEQFFADNNLDAIIYPTTALTAKTIEEVVVNGGNPFTNGHFGFALTHNGEQVAEYAYGWHSSDSPYLGLPSLSMPIGLTETSGLPVGMQIEGVPYGDSRVLEVGRAFERVFTLPAPEIAGDDDDDDQGED